VGWIKSLAGTAVVIGILVGIGALANSGDDGSSTSGSSSSRSSSFIDEIESYVASYIGAGNKADATAVESYDAARRSTSFQTAARSAATTAGGISL